MSKLAKQLSDQEISVLCDVGQAPALYCEAEKRRDLKRLHDAGLVRRCDEEAPIYALTDLGLAVLSEEGARERV